jgi:PhnB protein
MKMNTYLNYGGNCQAAMRFYEKNLGAKIGMMMTHGEAPVPVGTGPEWKDAILHASITIGDTVLMASDVPPDRFKPMRSAYLSLQVDSDDEAERVYGILSDGGEVYMTIQETFFASRFAQLRDQFGTLWMIIHDRPMPSGA